MKVIYLHSENILPDQSDATMFSISPNPFSIQKRNISQESLTRLPCTEEKVLTCEYNQMAEKLKKEHNCHTSLIFNIDKKEDSLKECPSEVVLTVCIGYWDHATSSKRGHFDYSYLTQTWIEC